MEATVLYWGSIGIVEKKMETTIAYWVYIGAFCSSETGPEHVERERERERDERP